MQLPPGFGITSPIGFEGLATQALQDPGSVASQFAMAGIPPPSAALNPTAGFNTGALGSLMSGVKAPAGPPAPMYPSGAPSVPSPANISGASSGINSVMGRTAPPVPVPPVQSLGALMRQGR